jgi:hypothetical protein
VREYRLQPLRFRVVKPEGPGTGAPNGISLSRDITYDDSNVLAKDQEESLLWRDMNNDLVNQIMRRLSHHQAERTPRIRRRRVMLLKGEQLDAHLERELRPLYVLYGDEPLLVLEAADAIRAKAARKQGYSEREVLTVLPGSTGANCWHAAATCRCSAIKN